MTQKERQERSRAEILQAAMEEFSVRDYNQVNMEGICSRHGISKGMMYHYYSSKDELFLLCVQDTFERLREYVQEEGANVKGVRVSERIKNYFLLREYFFQAHPERVRIFENAMLRPPEHLLEQIKTLREQSMIRSVPLRPGLDQDAAVRYLESAEPVFRAVVLRYQAEKPTQDFHTMLEAVEEVLDMALFGVFRSEPG